MTTKKKNKRARPVKRDPNRYPKGWNRKRVEALIEYYENQSDEDAIAEAEAAYKNNKLAMIAVPVELVPAVDRLIARRRAG